jgi:hypothetical protein
MAIGAARRPLEGHLSSVNVVAFSLDEKNLGFLET